MIDKARSLYLELLRIIAALYVFIYHFGSEPIEGQPFFASSAFNSIHHINWYGAHFVVIIFFVLSGFLITMSACKKKVTFESFIIARLGRLYSVVVPALIFTYFVTGILIHSGYKIEGDDNLISRFILNLLFLTQSWSLCAMPPADGPFWSISYEFFYYLIIGTCLLTRKYYRTVLLILITFIAGLKVILLLPAWLAGSFLFYLINRRIVFPIFLSFLLFFLSLLLIIYTLIHPYSFPFLELNSSIKLLTYPLFFSWNFKADYLFAILITIHIYSFFGISQKLNSYLNSSSVENVLHVIYKAGNCTFTLYLFHVPLMFFFASVFPYNKLNSWHNILLICSTLLCVYFIARVTEWKVKHWRQFIDKIFNALLKTKLFKKFKSTVS